MNKVILAGRLTKDPETRVATTKNGDMTVVKFSLAVNRDYKQDNGPSADFFDCVIFGKRADVIAKYFHRGSRINVSGRIENNNWTDQQGAKHYATQIRVEEFDFVDTKQESGAASGENPNGPDPDQHWMDIPDGIDNDLPFK